MGQDAVVLVGVTFGAWCPLADAAAHAPARPGVAQLRQAHGLRDYPRGKSAMVHYEATDDLQALARRLGATFPAAPWLWRSSQEVVSPERAVAEFETLHRMFVTRFGAPPSG